MIDLTSPQTPDEIGPPAGSPDALAMWRDVLARLAAMSPRDRAHLDLALVTARGDQGARVISVDPVDGDLDLRDREGRPLVDEADLALPFALPEALDAESARQDG